MEIVYNIEGIESRATFTFAENTMNIRNGFYVTLVEQVFKQMLIKSGASSNVYTNRPKSLSESVNDFVVVSMQGSLEDMSAYGECTVNVSLFARDAAGFKNGNKLNAMQYKATGQIPISVTVLNKAGLPVHEYIITQTPDIVGDAPDDYGFHCRMILFQTTLKVIE